AWDANATLVTIDTNYPNFFQLVVQDNGDGFAREEFERLMEGGIGNSEKRVDERQLKFGRPIIGRLGIGMLGIAQICGSFVVMSRPRQGE
uniref:ATP-binding protein n=1 Tax=Escherichia coli TaxID=562 RepID=UPI00147A9275